MTFKEEFSLRAHVGFPGLLMTDSGAFQGLPPELSNSSIVKFQEPIANHNATPLDMVTPPGDSRSVAEDRMKATLKTGCYDCGKINSTLNQLALKHHVL